MFFRRSFQTDSVEAHFWLLPRWIVLSFLVLDRISTWDDRWFFSDAALTAPQDLRPAADFWVSLLFFFYIFLSITLHSSFLF